MAGGIIVLLHNGMKSSHTIKYQKRRLLSIFFWHNTFYIVENIIFQNVSSYLTLYVIALIQPQL